MARFDLYRSPPLGFVVDVQSDHLDHLASRIVIPLLATVSVPRALPILQPVFDVDGAAFVLVTHRLGSVQRARLGSPVGNISHYRDDILRALDMLFTGF